MEWNVAPSSLSCCWFCFVVVVDDWFEIDLMNINSIKGSTRKAFHQIIMCCKSTEMGKQSLKERRNF